MDSHLLRSVFNVVKQFFSEHVLNVYPTFHSSSMCFCEAQYGHTDCSSWSHILTARLSSVDQCSLAWDEIVFKHNSPDN